MNNLRWLVKKDGSKVLQERRDNPERHHPDPWIYIDIPSIPEVKEEVKPRVFWIQKSMMNSAGVRYAQPDKPEFEEDFFKTVELPKGSRVLSRREVIHAIEAVINLSQHQVDLISNNLGFEVYK